MSQPWCALTPIFLQIYQLILAWFLDHSMQTLTQTLSSNEGGDLSLFFSAYTASLAPTHHSSSTSVAVAVIASVAGTLSIVLVILLIVVWTRRHRSASRVLRHRSVTKRRHHSLSKSARFNNFSYDGKLVNALLITHWWTQNSLSWALYPPCIVCEQTLQSFVTKAFKS